MRTLTFSSLSLLLVVFTSVVFADNRFQAPDVNAPATNFSNAQVSSSTINTPYLVVSLKSKLNERLKNHAEAGQSVNKQDVLNQLTQNNSVIQTTDHSVILLPGAFDYVNQINIVNIDTNNGESLVGVFE